MHFHYVYYTYLPTDNFYEKSYIVQSRVPNFTAEKISHNGWGRRTDAKVNDTDIPMMHLPFAFLDQRGRSVTVDGFMMYVNGVQVYDATDHIFLPRKPMDIHGNTIDTLPDTIWG